MKDNRAPNYGIDAPLVVRKLLIVSALGVISLVTLLLGAWSKQDLIAVIAWPLIWAPERRCFQNRQAPYSAAAGTLLAPVARARSGLFCGRAAQGRYTVRIDP
jgi:hypothetical protein